ncbi:MAG: APC family permease [Pirellulales bacterium]|nr:APC family permease [Pirellulales bacterium]
MHEPPSPSSEPHLLRRFNLLEATALNMSNMVGVGPFLTIPILLSFPGLVGPQAMLGWIAAFILTMCDSLIWSELGAAMPGSGGSYLYLREGFGRETFGRLMAFLFIWQFIFSGPLEIASGYIGFAKYFSYMVPERLATPGWLASILPSGVTSQAILVAAAVGLLNVVVLYRRITTIGVLTVCLWIGTLITVSAVILTGVVHFNPKLAFDFPPGAFSFSFGFFLGLGKASAIGVYDYLGYYDVCYIGEEVKNPGKVIPRSILLSLTVVALVYFTMNLSVIGVIPWREFIPATQGTISDYIVSHLMERVYGVQTAQVFTLLVLWTTFGSVFALLLGYSRIPYAAAQDGCFFSVFAKLHPTKSFPHVSVLVIGLISVVCCVVPLDVVIGALITTRILVQFVGQNLAVIRLRRVAPDLERPYRIWLYPVPNLIALAGWLFIFFTSEPRTILFGLGMLLLGVIFFLVWSRWSGRWPFGAES